MKKIFFRYCVLQASYWSFFAALPAYLTARMLSLGMAPSLLGILISVNLACAFVGSLFWGRVVDRFRAGKRYVIAAFIAVTLLASVIFGFAGNVVILFILYPLFGFLNGSIATNIDSWVIAVTGQVDAGSRTRACGTLSFAVTMLVCGQLIRHVGYQPLPYIAIGLALIGIITACFQPELPPIVNEKAIEKARQRKSDSVGKLMTSREFLLLVAVVFFTGMAISPLNSMKVVIFESVGADAATLGTDSFIGCLAQAPMLSLAGKLRRFRPEYRMMGGVFCMLMYAFLLLIANHPAVVIAGTLMQNAGFGLLLPTMREMAERTVSPSLRTTANSITDVAYGSISGMIASLWSGAILETAGKAALGGLSVMIQLVAIGFAVILYVKSRKTAVKPKAAVIS